MQKIKQYKGQNSKEKLTVYLTNAKVMDFIKNSVPKDKDPRKAIENVDTLIRLAASYNTLEDFYEQISLLAGETEQKQEKKDSIKVLTIHSSKGLEWKYVFLPGWVKGKLPM
jgi:superfamily I DNA/RNA helicase